MQNAKKPAAAQAAKPSEGYNFGDYKKDSLTRPRDKAWDNWAKFEKVGDKAQGFIRDVFYRPEEGQYKEQRCVTLEQADGTLINAGMKRLPFILPKTDNLRIGDPLTIELEELMPSKTKGYSPTKVFGFYGVQLPENAAGKSVKQLEAEDIAAGGTVVSAADQAEGDGSEVEVEQ